jgi:hypothetical protein
MNESESLSLSKPLSLSLSRLMHLSPEVEMRWLVLVWGVGAGELDV